MLGFLKKKRSVVLVLGGGSARGLAHIGVLRVLEKEKIPIHRIVGTSMGALIGAAYSVGVSVKKMEDMAHKFNWKTIFDPTIPRMGLLAGKKLERIVTELTENKGFNDCKIPLAVVATDIEKNERVVFQKGNLQKVVSASCSWPGIFNPVRIDGRLLVDGGIKNSVPTRIARALDPGYMIAVDVGFCVKSERHKIPSSSLLMACAVGLESVAVVVRLSSHGSAAARGFRVCWRKALWMRFLAIP